MEFIKSSFEEKKVVIFGIFWQADTIVVKSVFDQYKQKFLFVEVEDYINRVKLENTLFKCSGGHTEVPYVFINGKYIGSIPEVVLLDVNDELKKMLSEPHPSDAKDVKKEVFITDEEFLAKELTGTV